MTLGKSAFVEVEGDAAWRYRRRTSVCWRFGSARPRIPTPIEARGRALECVIENRVLQIGYL
jgi:hypothetical protein